MNETQIPAAQVRRMKAHAEALPKKVCCQKHWVSMNYHVWMPMARRWKMPIKQVKAIVKGDGHANVLGA